VVFTDFSNLGRQLLPGQVTDSALFGSVGGFCGNQHIYEEFSPQDSCKSAGSERDEGRWVKLAVEMSDEREEKCDVRSRNSVRRVASGSDHMTQTRD
jgi:hypothetical protein